MTTPASALYLFQGSNIGPNGVLADAIDIPEMMYLIQKKFLGSIVMQPERPPVIALK